MLTCTPRSQKYQIRPVNTYREAVYFGVIHGSVQKERSRSAAQFMGFSSVYDYTHSLKKNDHQIWHGNTLGEELVSRC